MSLATLTMTNEDFYQSLLDNLDDTVIFVDCDGRVTYANHATEDLSGYTGEDLTGSLCDDRQFFYYDSEQAVVCPDEHPVSRVLSDGQKLETDLYLRHKNGYPVPVHVRVIPITDAFGTMTGVIEISSDNSAKIAAEEKMNELREKSLLDPLTNLPSRRCLEMRLQSRLDEMRRYGWQFGVAVARINNVQVIRESHGQEITDQLVKTVAKAFANTLRTYDVAGRWCEDEFLAIVPVKKSEDMDVIGKRVCSLVGEAHICANSKTLGVTITIGSLSAGNDDCVETIVERARMLMYENMQTGPAYLQDI